MQNGLTLSPDVFTLSVFSPASSVETSALFQSQASAVTLQSSMYDRQTLFTGRIITNRSNEYFIYIWIGHNMIRFLNLYAVDDVRVCVHVCL